MYSSCWVSGIVTSSSSSSLKNKSSVDLDNTLWEHGTNKPFSFSAGTDGVLHFGD